MFRGCVTVFLWVVLPTFWRYSLPESAAHADFLLALFFEPEDGGIIFLRNLGWLLADNTALHNLRSCTVSVFIHRKSMPVHLQKLRHFEATPRNVSNVLYEVSATYGDHLCK
jgi:hypothetical protein